MALSTAVSTCKRAAADETAFSNPRTSPEADIVIDLRKGSCAPEARCVKNVVLTRYISAGGGARSSSCGRQSCSEDLCESRLPSLTIYISTRVARYTSFAVWRYPGSLRF